jgi:ankyrin repeat protein
MNIRKPIVIAAENGHIEEFKLLLSNPEINPATQNDLALIRASKNGHTDIIKLLLNDKRVNPASSGNLSIQYAYNEGHHEIVFMLICLDTVKSHLIENNLPLYNKLLKYVLSNKIENF